MQHLGDYIGEIESWIDQVRDDELGVEDYDFIDNIVHKGRDGNNGLGQVGAYLAVYKNEEGELEVDEELVDALDERQSELPQGGANRFSNIIYEGNTKKRDGKTLLDKEVDGHERLHTMLEAAKEEFNDLTEKSAPEDSGPENSVSPNDDEYVIKVDVKDNNSSQNQTTGRPIPDGSMPVPTNTTTQGGDNTMGDLREVYDFVKEETDGLDQEYQDDAQAMRELKRVVGESQEYLNAIETAIGEFDSDVKEMYGEIKAAAAEARGTRETVMEDLEDKNEAIEHSGNKILEGWEEREEP